MIYKTFTYTLLLLLSITIVFGLNQVSIPGINREDVGGVTYIVLNNITNNFTNTNYTSNVSFYNINVTNQLTVFGKLLVNTLSVAQNLTPSVTSIYSLGNSSLWWGEAYINSVYAKTINATNVTSTNVYSGFVSSDEINSTGINSDVLSVESNISLGGYKFIRDGDDLVVII